LSVFFQKLMDFFLEKCDLPDIYPGHLVPGYFKFVFLAGGMSLYETFKGKHPLNFIPLGKLCLITNEVLARATTHR
jgi:hypothetical protein